MVAILKKKAKKEVSAVVKAPKKQTLKKTQKTETIRAAKKLEKLSKKKAISEKVSS